MHKYTRNQDGISYFYNSKTNDVSWSKPRALMSQAELSQVGICERSMERSVQGCARYQLEIDGMHVHLLLSFSAFCIYYNNENFIC